MQNTAPLSFSMKAFNRATTDQATAMMDRIVEKSAWLARRAAEARPFSDTDDFAAWIEMEVLKLSKDEALQLLCAHPELSPPDPTAMTRASQVEQGRLDLMNLDHKTAAKLFELNRSYTRRHGYPFVVALHEYTDVADVLKQFEVRISADSKEELARSLGQVVSVMKSRLIELTSEADPPRAYRQKDVANANSGGPTG